MRCTNILPLFGYCLIFSLREISANSHRPAPFLNPVDAVAVIGIRDENTITSLSSKGIHSDIRGGACSDTDASLFIKVGASAAVETLTLLGVFYAGKEVAENMNIGKVLGLPVSMWISIFLVVFGSSIFGSFVDGGMSVATQQALDPNIVPGDPNWYAKLKKPSWTPPGWVFPIMWLIVSKPTQAVALSKLFKAKELIPWDILAVYCAHLSLGDAWNKVFFGFQCTGRGTAVITFFFGLLLSSAYLFMGVDTGAGQFLLPTCGWVLVATALNWNIYLSNK